MEIREKINGNTGKNTYSYEILEHHHCIQLYGGFDGLYWYWVTSGFNAIGSVRYYTRREIDRG